MCRGAHDAAQTESSCRRGTGPHRPDDRAVTCNKGSKEAGRTSCWDVVVLGGVSVSEQ